MDRQYVGIDFHRRRSVIVRKNAGGQKLSSVCVPNDPLAIAAVTSLTRMPSPAAPDRWCAVCRWTGDATHRSTSAVRDSGRVQTCSMHGPRRRSRMRGGRRTDRRSFLPKRWARTPSRLVRIVSAFR